MVKRLKKVKHKRGRKDPVPRKSLAQRLITGICLPLVCGALFGFSFVYPKVLLLSWCGLILLIALLYSLPVRRALLVGWLFGVSWNIVTQYWLPGTMERYASFHFVTAQALFTLLCVLAGAQFGVFGMLLALCKGRRVHTILLIPLTWVAVESLWINLFPWRLGHSQRHWLHLVQVCDLAGVHLVSFLMAWHATLIYRLLRALPVSGRWRHDLDARERRALRVSGISYAAVLVAVLLYGHWRIIGVDRLLASTPGMKVALIQPGIEHRQEHLLQRSYAVADQVDLISWPESSVGMIYDINATAFSGPGSESIQQRPCPHLNSLLLFGGTTLIEQAADGMYYLYNSVFLTDKQERILGRYHKRMLIPFGEYIPGEGRFPKLHAWFSPFKQAMFRPGRGVELLHTPDGIRIGVLICYEDLLAELGRITVARGAQVLSNHTNDVWFGDSRARAQHQFLASFRSIELKRYLLRATLNGSTSIIDPAGRVVAQAPPDKPFTLVHEIHPLNYITVYTRIGDAFAWICVLIVAILLIQRWRQRIQAH